MTRNHTDKVFYPGDRVFVFCSSLFKDDEKTPLSYTMRPATVVHWRCCEGAMDEYDNVIDVRFDHDPENISFGHFSDHVLTIEEVIKYANRYRYKFLKGENISVKDLKWCGLTEEEDK